MVADRPARGYEARRWLTTLAAFLLFAWALVPIGYMPDLQAPDSRFRFVVCHASDPYEAPAAPTGGDARADSCPFAPLAHGALLLAALLVWARLATGRPPRLLTPARPIAARRLNPKPIGARAPPFSFP